MMKYKKIKKKRILFILNTYHFMSSNLETTDYKKAYNELDKIDKSWANVFYNSLKKKNYYLKKDYPNLNKILAKDETHVVTLEKKIKSFKPNLIFSTVDDQKIEKLLGKFKDINKIVWISSPELSKKIQNFKGIYNFILSGNKTVLNIAKKNKFKTFSLLISSPYVTNLQKKNFLQRENNLYFAGSLGPNFKKRYIFLEALSSTFELKVRIRNLIEKYYILNLMNYYLGKLFPKLLNKLYKLKLLPITNSLKKINEDEIFGKKMLNELVQHKFCININSDFDNKNINSRVFEALSCGCLLFTDRNEEINKIFKTGKHLVYFNSFDDLKKKIYFYKKNTNYAYKIAKRGNNFFLKKHQSKIRFKEFEKIIKKII